MAPSVRLLFLLSYFGCHIADSSVIKRSDDTSPLVAVVDQLSNNVQTLQAQLNALTNKVDEQTAVNGQHVGFSVGLKNSVESSFHNGATIKFNDVYSNVGNAYDLVVGQFVAPVTGLYVFYFKTEAAPQKSVGIDLYRDGQRIAHIWTGASSVYETAGDLEVVQLTKGERLWVVRNGGSEDFLRGLHGTRFSGFLLYPIQPSV